MKKLLIFILALVFTNSLCSDLEQVLKSTQKDLKVFTKDKVFDAVAKKQMVLGRLKQAIPPAIPELRSFAENQNGRISICMQSNIIDISAEDRETQKWLVFCIELKIKPQVALGILKPENPRLIINTERIASFYKEEKNQKYTQELLCAIKEYQEQNDIISVFLTNTEFKVNTSAVPTIFERESYLAGLQLAYDNLYKRADKSILDEDELEMLDDLDFKIRNHRTGLEQTSSYAGQKRSSSYVNANNNPCLRKCH